MSEPRHFFVPDESGMGGDWSYEGEVYYDPDAGRWYRRLSKFRAVPCDPPDNDETDSESVAPEETLGRDTPCCVPPGHTGSLDIRALSRPRDKDLDWPNGVETDYDKP